MWNLLVSELQLHCLLLHFGIVSSNSSRYLLSMSAVECDSICLGNCYLAAEEKSDAALPTASATSGWSDAGGRFAVKPALELKSGTLRGFPPLPCGGRKLLCMRQIRSHSPQVSLRLSFSSLQSFLDCHCTMSASALWIKIDLTAEDGGLASCFAAANVAPTLVANIREVQECKTLRDFAASYTEQDHV